MSRQQNLSFCFAIRQLSSEGGQDTSFSGAMQTKPQRPCKAQPRSSCANRGSHLLCPNDRTGRLHDIIFFTPQYGPRVVLAVQTQNKATYFYRTAVKGNNSPSGRDSKKGGGQVTKPRKARQAQNTTSQPSDEVLSADDFGMERRGFIAPESFRVPRSLKPDDKRVLRIAVILRPGKRTGREKTEFYWCDANETSQALQSPTEIKRCKQKLVPILPNDGSRRLYDLVLFKPPYGERVVLAVQPSQKNSFYRTVVKKASRQGSSAGTAVKLCSRQAQELAAFNDRPHCHSPRDTLLDRPLYREKQGNRALFKPSILVRQAKAYYCYELETQIKTTAWFLGALTSRTSRRRRGVRPLTCRHLALNHNCTHGKLNLL